MEGVEFVGEVDEWLVGECVHVDDVFDYDLVVVGGVLGCELVCDRRWCFVQYGGCVIAVIRVGCCGVVGECCVLFG